MLIETAAGIGIATLLFGARQARLRHRFKQAHGEQIRKEKEKIAQAWRDSRPVERTLIIERTFRPNGLLAPTVVIRSRFKR